MIVELDRNKLVSQRDYAIKASQRAMNRLAEIKDVLDKNSEEALEELRDYILGVEMSYRVMVQFSTGGDGDGFILYFDEHKDLIGGVWYWEDWNSYAEHRLFLDEDRMLDEIFNCSSYLYEVRIE